MPLDLSDLAPQGARKAGKLDLSDLTPGAADRAQEPGGSPETRLQEQGVTREERWAINNLSLGVKSGMKFLRDRGYEVQPVEGGEYAVKKPGQPWRQIEGAKPGIWNAIKEVIKDLGPDAMDEWGKGWAMAKGATMGGTAGTALGGPAGGVAGGIAGGAAGGAAAEAARRLAGRAYGFEEEPGAFLPAVGEEALTGAVFEGGLSALKGAKYLALGKKAAPVVEGAPKPIGIDALPPREGLLQKLGKRMGDENSILRRSETVIREKTGEAAKDLAKLRRGELSDEAAGVKEAYVGEGRAAKDKFAATEAAAEPIFQENLRSKASHLEAREKEVPYTEGLETEKAGLKAERAGLTGERQASELELKPLREAYQRSLADMRAGFLRLSGEKEAALQAVRGEAEAAAKKATKKVRPKKPPRERLVPEGGELEDYQRSYGPNQGRQMYERDLAEMRGEAAAQAEEAAKPEIAKAPAPPELTGLGELGKGYFPEATNAAFTVRGQRFHLHTWTMEHIGNDPELLGLHHMAAFRAGGQKLADALYPLHEGASYQMRTLDSALAQLKRENPAMRRALDDEIIKSLAALTLKQIPRTDFPPEIVAAIKKVASGAATAADDEAAADVVAAVVGERGASGYPQWMKDLIHDWKVKQEAYTRGQADKTLKGIGIEKRATELSGRQQAFEGKPKKTPELKASGLERLRAQKKAAKAQVGMHEARAEKKAGLREATVRKEAGEAKVGRGRKELREYLRQRAKIDVPHYRAFRTGLQSGIGGLVGGAVGGMFGGYLGAAGGASTLAFLLAPRHLDILGRTLYNMAHGEGKMAALAARISKYAQGNPKKLKVALYAAGPAFTRHVLQRTGLHR